MTKVNIKVKRFDAIVLGRSRDELRNEICIDASYSD